MIKKNRNNDKNKKKIKMLYKEIYEILDGNFIKKQLFICLNCGIEIEKFSKKYKYCPGCGKLIDKGGKKNEKRN